HGANIAFVLWGAYLGFVLAIERILEPKLVQGTNIISSKTIRFLRNTITLNLFLISGLFFRAGSAGKNSVSFLFDLMKRFSKFFFWKSSSSLGRTLVIHTTNHRF
ncbi:hypothetical protein LEP1GSC037_4815, partial [Leptospira interrogans str. 2006001854]